MWHKIIALFLTLFFNLSFISDLTSQNLVTEDDLSLAKKYRDLYKNHEAVILESETSFQFSLGKDGKPFVTETEKLTYLSLRVNNAIAKDVFFDINSEVKDQKLLKKNKKSDGYLRTTCGDYEVEGIFHSDTKLCLYRIAFAQLGEIKTFSYTRIYKDIKFFSSYYFPDSYPTILKKVVFNIPKSIEVEIKEFNLPGFKISKKEEKDSEGNKVILYSTENLVSFKKEFLSYGTAYSYPHLLFLTKSYYSKTGKISLIESIDDQYKWYTSLLESEINENSSELKTLTEKLIQGKKTDHEKVSAIFYWVQDNIKYIAFEYGIAGYKPESAINVYKSKYGDCKGMANLTKTLLKIAGFDARLTWLGTSSIPSTHTIPFLASQDHMICTLILKGEKYYLDPTEKYISLNDMAERIQGREVLIEDGLKYLVLKTPEKTNERNKVQISQEFEIEGTSLVGKGTAIFNGERKIGIINLISRSKEEEKKEIFKSMILKTARNAEIEELKIKDLYNREVPLDINYLLKVNNIISSFDQDLYVIISPFRSFINYKAEKDRISDLNFGEKILETIEVKLKIPEGYKLKDVPENFSQSSDGFSFNVKFIYKGNSLIYNTVISINKGFILKEKFEVWNASLDKLNLFFNEPIVLTKI